MRIEQWPLSRLEPYVNNPRKNDHAVERMATVIKEFGFRLPVLALSSGELIDGHLRLKAAHHLQLQQVPVMLADDMSAEQVRAFRLLVNRSATWATWDESLLAEEIAALIAANFDVTLTGFDQAELDTLLRESVATEKDPDALPDVPVSPVVKEGEVWLMGNHRLLCGNSCSSLDVGRLMAGKLATMVFTDPPYNVNYAGKAGTIKNDNMSSAQFDAFLFDAMQQMLTVLVPGGGIYVCHSEAGEGLTFRQVFQRAGFRFASCLVWNKGQAVLGRSDYQFQHEPILYGWKPGTAHKWYGNRKQKSVFEVPLPGMVQQADGSWTLLVDGKLYRLSGENIYVEELPGTVINVPKPPRNEDHPTPKPVELVETCVSNSSRSGGIVYEPFSGSGSTIVGCERLGRICYAMELAPKFVQVDILRWQQFTGKQAVRESDGILFDELLMQ